MTMKCDPRAYAQCPTREYCGSCEDADFREGSECDQFNKWVQSRPVTNGDRLRAMGDRELADFLSSKFSEVFYLEHCLTEIQLQALKHNLFCIFMKWLKQPEELKGVTGHGEN